MKAFDTDRGLRWLFCMTHPDDEIVICAWIRRLTHNGNQVFLSWTHSTPEREAEAIAASALLGVPLSNLRFLRAPDGEVAESIPVLLPEYRALMEEIKPDRVVCNAFEQGHIDHDATNYLVAHTYDGPIFEVPVYHTYSSITGLQALNRFADPRGQEVFELTPDEKLFKIEFAKQFPSQTIWKILFWHAFCHRLLGRRADLESTERMRIQGPIDYLRPNLPPHLARRVEQTEKWRRWCTLMQALPGRLGDSDETEQVLVAT